MKMNEPLAGAETIEFKLNGDTVSAFAGETIIQAAKRHGVEIPHLCYKDGYRPDGNCRACVVEIKGERVLAPSCCRAPAKGMEVQSNSARAVHSQKIVVELLMASGIPIIEMWDTGGAVIDTAVGFDHAQVGFAQAQHLIEQGYRRIAFLGSVRDNDKRAQKRLSGVQAAAAEAGLPEIVRHTTQQNGSPELGQRLAADLLKDHPEIDAIVCNSDVVAFGVLNEARRLGRRIPEDIGVIAFGDNEAASCVAPSLTTIKPDREQIGRATADAIISRIDGAESETTTVEWRLIVRESTRRPGAADEREAGGGDLRENS
jgi:ferredoxin